MPDPPDRRRDSRGRHAPKARGAGAAAQRRRRGVPPGDPKMTERQEPPSSPTLEEAVRCPLLAGDSEQWVRCCTGRFLPLARRLADGDDIARDALQESWIIVMEKLHQYRGDPPACGWVRAIVHHEASHAAASRSRYVSLAAEDSDEQATLRPAQPPGRAPWPSPEAAAYDRELMRLLVEVIDDLPPTFRDVARMRDIEERSTDEVARRLHISSQNVKVRLHRARKLLRPRLLRRIADPHRLGEKKL